MIQDRQVRKQNVQLWNHRKMLRCDRQLEEIFTRWQQRLTLGRPVNSAQEVHQRRFPAAIGSQEAKNSVFWNVKRHIRDGVELTVVAV